MRGDDGEDIAADIDIAGQTLSDIAGQALSDIAGQTLSDVPDIAGQTLSDVPDIAGQTLSDVPAFSDVPGRAGGYCGTDTHREGLVGQTLTEIPAVLDGVDEARQAGIGTYLPCD